MRRGGSAGAQPRLHLGDLGSPAAGGTSHLEEDEADPRFRLAHGPERGVYGRWDVHAGALVPAGDHAGREKLLRYLARAPLSFERMSLTSVAAPNGPAATQRAAQPPARCDPRATADDAASASYRTRMRWYIDWATLLRRVYDVDVLACSCGSKLKFIELVDNERDARAFLETGGATLGFIAEPTSLLPMALDGDT